MNKLAVLLLHVGRTLHAAALTQRDLVRDTVRELLHSPFPVSPAAEGWVPVPRERWRHRNGLACDMVLTHARGAWVRMESVPPGCFAEHPRADMERFMERVS